MASDAPTSRAFTTPSDTTALENELASLVRVRNRLAQSTDSALPRILTGLLPKVLVKLEATYDEPQIDTSEESSLLRAQIRGHLMGILMHALERIRGNAEMELPWLSQVAVSLESPSRVVRTIALAFLQAAIPRCQNCRDAIPMAALLKAVDACHKRPEELSEASRLELRTTSWILLDAIAVVSGLTPMVDFDLDCYNEDGRLGVYEPPREASETVPLVKPDSIDAVSQDGAGVWDLMLDVFLFWPAPPPRRQWPQQNNRAEEATSGGISLEGRGRMAFRLKERSWNDMTQGYLRYLKAACFRFCVSKEHPCIFQGAEGSVGESRALLLSVMLANVNSMVGKQANGYLNIHFSETPRKVVTIAPQQPLGGCSMSMACSLLVLILGDTASAPIVEQYPNQRHLWLDILGPQSTETTAARAPLPPPISARAIEFISNRLVVPCLDTEGMDALKLFVDLAVTVQKNHLEDGLWAIRLIYGLYKQGEEMEDLLKDGEWMNDFRSKCITCAKDTLAGLPDPAVGTRATAPREDTVGPVHRAIARRRAEEELFAKHRSSLRKKRLRYDDAMKARENAYELISKLGCYGGRAVRSDGEKEGLTFDLPIVLFKCAVSEDTMMKPRATRALSDLLASFKSEVVGGKEERKALQRQAAYLIPSLVDASYCEAEAVRLASAQWTADLLLLVDPQAAFCLSGFLAKDTDSRVSRVAKSVVENAKLQKLCQGEVAHRAMFEFLNLSTSRDEATLTMELEVRIASISKELNIPTSAASVLLSSFQGSPKDAIDACTMDRDGVLQRCGVAARCGIASESIADDNMDESFVCGICYDDEITSSDSYAMSCGHRFCTPCWKSFFENAFSEGPSHVLKATCPCHECTERITGVELNDIIPEKVEQWRHFFLRQFVEQEKTYRFCPGPDCDVVAVSLGDTGPVKCTSCGEKFCFGCGEQQHIPALCADFEKWQSIFGSSEFWVAKNSKPCPNCGVPIEKGQGCNHMQCSQCHYDFCWICLAHLETHMMAHTCNQYDPAEHAKDDDEQMRLFFTDRFQAHEEAEFFARKRLDEIEDNVQHLLDKFWLLETEEAQDLVNAEETLVEARRFLKYSYVAAYGMKDDESRRKIFESHQGALELLTETLSGLTELNLETAYVERGENSLRLHLRAISFYTSIVSKYMDRIANLDCVTNYNH
jgi:ariadne-1